MLIPRFIIAMLIGSITVILCSKYGFEYLEVRDTNDVIGYSECLKNDIKNNSDCYERFIK